ncbi:MAG: glycosyltransferase [Firmicutes bacterium HGW-Firmicutes-15]|nr:MAG: glycosyltransferase [Firmicutes bacterium HGW-Firmicutes-15]
MEKRENADILGCRVDLLTAEEAISGIKSIIDRGQPAHIITLNAEIVYQAQSSQDLRTIINSADLITPDGIGIVWAGRKLGFNIRERVTGIDLFYRLCQEAPVEQWKIYLLGSAPGVADAAASKLAITYPGLQICGTHHGYFGEEDMPAMVQEIRELAPHILFVALGAPKQETWIKKYKEQLGVPACIGVGGSLDVIAGYKKRAPGWMIKINMEWLYRLLAEPSRFKRQLVLPKFVTLILKNKHKRRI